MSKSCHLRYHDGRLTLSGAPADVRSVRGVRWDPERKFWHADAYHYRDIVLHFHQQQAPLIDEARHYHPLKLSLKRKLQPRPHQAQALEKWIQAGRRGVVSMPTGAGKTIFAVMAIQVVERPTLVLVPTIDLLHQWHGILTDFFGIEIGAVGGGKKSIEPITVATYDSAWMMIRDIGSQFGFLVFDECHHLPANQYQQIAREALAPFRLGLSATVERADGREELLYDLVGDLVFEASIHNMSANVLAPYDVVNVQIPLSDKELSAYKEARQKYLQFVKQNRINFSDAGAWQLFIRKASQSAEGREAMRAHRLQKKLAQGAEGKLNEIWRILRQHAHDRVIIFTDDNSFAYRIGRELILPVLTHHTKMKERKEMLAAFSEGRLNVIVTSKVLNEGVDVPEASVGIVASGSGNVREHVQRLGRILRHKPGKRAVLFELIAKDTSELYVNWRRRQHHAYQRPRPMPSP